ncbi:MAG: DNA polymerase III subunit delta [Marinobacterium sp.]|nr:DNA polymerase III subunit delta [Marinobacterium sp.]
MKIRPDQLENQLSKGLAPIYLITGDEPLLSDESSDFVRARFQQQGFSEREVMHVDASFNWEYLLECANALSLFAEKKVIELRLGSQKLNKNASQLLQQYLANPAPDNVILMLADKLDGGTKKSAWFKAVEKTGVVVEIWPIDAVQLPKWLQTRAASLGLTLDREAIGLLCDRVEGNLLAARQELDKLSLLYPGQKLTADIVINAVSDSSRYDIYGLSDAAIQGQAARTQKILQVLRQEGTQPSVILWALSREIRSLLAIQQGLDAGIAYDTLCQRERIWGKRKQLVRQAANRIPQSILMDLLKQCFSVDQMIKGARQGNSWLELSMISLSLAGRPVALHTFHHHN